MLFNSFDFLIFFPVVVTIFYLLPHKNRWLLLLLSSYFFYGSWKAEYLLLILASTCIDYFAARRIHKARSKKKKIPYLLLSIAGNMGPLLLFKYLDFFNESAAELAQLIGWNYPIEALALILPVGISFYSFQTLSYTIDVFHGKIKPEKHFGIFALYVSFFPQLVAGPIERPAHLIPQFKKKVKFNWARIQSGLTLMLWGFFMKIVIADQSAGIVNRVFNNPEDFTGLPIVTASVFFAFQILGDFGGYSNIAIGAARVMGFDLMKNFDRPYFSKSVGEFWRRWHISLSTWFRDYLYIPLGGNRVVKWRWYYNLFITFTISGLWHGAAWTFVIWGALHGFFLVFSEVTKRKRAAIKESIGVVSGSPIDKIWQSSVVFVLVLIGWVFFRANSLGDALYLLTNAHVGLMEQIIEIKSPQDFADLLEVNLSALSAASIGIAIMLWVNYLQRGKQIYVEFMKRPRLIRWGIYYALIIVILLFGSFNSEEFIYFQF